MNNVTRILIVEDEFSDYELVQREIRNVIQDCIFKLVETKETYLDALSSFQPDIIISDFYLPRFEGSAALKLAKEYTPLTPLIVWSGAISEDVAAECLMMGATNFVFKDNIKRLGPVVVHALNERQAMLQRKQAEEKFQAIFENSPVGIFQSSAQGRFISVNAAMARIYGYASPQELIDSITDIASQIYIETQDRNQFTQLLQTNNSVENFEMKNVRRDGSVFWTSTSARAVRDTAGNTLYYEGFLQDITDRKLAEEKLLESEARYHGIFDNVQDAIFVESPEGDILEVNQRACEIFGYSRQEFLKKKLSDIVPSQGYIVNVPDFNLFPGQTIETINVRANGEQFPVEISGGLYEFGGRSLFLIILRDITERKVAEQQLRMQEQRFRALIENAMDNISLVAGDGTLLWGNPAVNNTLGYEYDEFVNRNIFELMHPEDRTWTSELFAKLVAEPGSQQNGTFRLRHHDGTWRWMEATASNMLKEPSVNAIVINYRDVTERKNAEEELQKSQIQYQNLVETSNDLIWAVDGDGKITFINHAAKDIYGYEPEELIGRSFFELLDPEAKFEQVDIKEMVSQTNEYHAVESHVRHKDGRRFILSANSILLRDEQGNVTGVTGTSRNITRRKLAEETLREERNLLRTLIDNLPDRIYALDKQGRKTLSNSADCKASGNKTMEEVIGKTDFDLYPPELAESFSQSNRTVLDSGQPLVNFEEPGLDFEGNRVSILTTKIPLQDAKGNVIGLVGVGRDITERKQVEARIRDLLSLNEKMLNDFPLGILTYKLSGECVFANQNAATIFGTVIDNLALQNFHSIEAWKKSGLYTLAVKAISTKTAVTDDIHHVSTFGKDLWLTVHCVTFTSNDEEHLILAILDITERKQNEEKLLQSQRELTDAQRIAKIGSWSFDTLKNKVDWSDELYRIFGVEREAFGHSYDAFLALIHPDDRSLVQQINDNALKRGASFDAEYRVITSTGEVKTIREIGYARPSEDGQISSLFGTAQDITERKRAEEELRASEERFRQLADNIPEVFWMADAQTGKELYTSPASEKIWGRSPEYIVQEPDVFLDSIVSDDLPVVLEGLEREKSGENVEMEYRIIHPDGSIHWVWDRAFPIFDENGKVKILAGITADITERKQAEMALQESQIRYYDLFDNSPISLWEEDYSLVKERLESLQQAGITDLGEYLLEHTNVVLELASLVKIMDVNRASLDLYHAANKEDLLKNLLDLVSEKTLLHFQDELMGLMSPEARFSWEGKDETLDGKELTVMVNGSVAPGYEQNWSKVIVSIHDVTERKQAEERLRESEERYHGLFHNLLDGFALHQIVTDEQNNPIDYVFLEINPAFEKLTGLTAKDTIGRRATEIFPGIENERFIPIYGQVALTGQPVHFEEYFAVLNKYFEINAYSPQHGQFAVTFVDVTARKHSEKEIDRRAKETSALLKTSLALTNLDLKSILQTVGNSAKSLFAADGCRVFLMQPDGETLSCVLALQESAAAFLNLKVRLGEGVTGAVAASGKAEIINDMLNDPRAVQVQGTEEEKEAIMFAPLRERDHTIGVLSIRRAGAERPFQPADLELLEAFASMAASAVSNARLFEEAQQRLDELEAIYENGLAVSQLLEPKEIGLRIIETFAHYLSWHHVTIRLLHPETDELEVIAFNLPGLNEDRKIEMEYHFNQMVSRVGQGLSGWVVQTGTPIRTGNVHSNPQYVNTQSGIQSGLYMPLKVGDRLIGVISVESQSPDAFTEQDERLLATLASQAAVAFENARLYQAAHQELLERTRAQAALWASETHYRELADSITDILFEADYNLIYTHWNKASEMFSGIPAEDAIGKSMSDLFGTSEEQKKREEIYQSVLKQRQGRIFETELAPRGEKRVLEIHAYPSTRGVSVVARDITERKLTEILMEKRFELIEYSSRHSTTEVMQKVIDEVSELTESHIGFMHFVEDNETTITREAWSTETLQDFCRVEGGKMHYSADKAGLWADAIRERQSLIHNDYESVPDKQGHTPLIREMVIPIIRGEKVVAVMGVGNKPKDYTQHDIEIVERFADYAWDIIERREMEAALADERNQLAKRVEERTADLSRANSNLARALRVKDEFLANMSHELRTPLNAILGLSESLSEQVAGPLNEKQQRYLSTINESGHHLLSLINDILDLAKIEAGQIILDINKVDVNAVCQASLRMIKQLAQKKNQEVLFDIDSDVGLMWADERRLKQMIVNLLSNAVKFTPESGQLGLEVHGDEAGNRVLITVWDKGIGISNQDMERLFKPFVQLDAGLAREAAGTGLGLALVAQMARLHGGSVSVESQVGEGSRFTILLPWEPALATDASTRLRNTGKFRAIDVNATNKPTILLIEDTREVVMMLVDYLEMSGFKIITAQDGIDGIQQAKLFHPNLILMDVMMPGMDGFETTRRLRQDAQFRDMPIIALTALAMPSDRQRCLDAGMDEYISKPVNLKALVKLIQSILLEKEDKKPK